MNDIPIETIALKGLTLAPSQIWGPIRLVPVLRQNQRHDLRLTKQPYDASRTQVALAGRDAEKPDLAYYSYIPHGLILEWSNDGSPVAAAGTQLAAPKVARGPWRGMATQTLHRMAKRASSNSLRLLPLHMAMESYLALHFRGPDVTWTEYSRKGRSSHALSPRWERTWSGHGVTALEEALRLFEIHEEQVGVLLFIADSLASAFIVPQHEDYRALHTSLIDDFYAEFLVMWSCFHTADDFAFTVEPERIQSLADIAAVVAKLRADWADFEGGVMAGNLIGRPITTKRLYAAGPFVLQSFMTDLDLASENHIGEMIVRDCGEIEYLKTYRLAEAQTQRAWLLRELAAHQWNIAWTAEALNIRADDLILRIEEAGFGYLIDQGRMDLARKNVRVRQEKVKKVEVRAKVRKVRGETNVK